MSRSQGTPADPAGAAGEAADMAIESAQIAQTDAKAVAAAKREIDERFPSEHELMVRELAKVEQSALLRIGPRRNRWQELLGFEERMAEIEQRRAALLEEIGALNLRLTDEPARHTAALATWLEGGEKGERPASRAVALQAEIADRQAEYDALGLRYDETLRQRAEHVMRNRDRLVKDVAKAREKAAAEYERLVDAAEAARQELIDLRQTEIWAGLFPSDLLSGAPQVLTLVGASKRVQEPLLPGVQTGLEASGVFELLRADVRYCASVATLEQAAALEGKTTAALSGREARWQDGETDFIGPAFDATWAGSSEEAAEAERVKGYSESLRKRLWKD